MCETQSDLIFGYWDFKGIGQVGRYILAYCNVPYQDKRYRLPDEWARDKENLDLDFPNLPYVIHGDKKISESHAISEYIPVLANMKELNGFDDDTKVRIRMLVGILDDLKTEILKYILHTPRENFVGAKEKSWAEGLFKQKLTKLNKFMENKEFLCEKITIADFVLFNILDVLNDMDHDKLGNYGNLMAFHRNFCEIPAIKEVREAGDFPKTWFPLGISNWTHPE